MSKLEIGNFKITFRSTVFVVITGANCDKFITNKLIVPQAQLAIENPKLHGNEVKIPITARCKVFQKKTKNKENDLFP